jgi:hypothetical protein
VPRCCEEAAKDVEPSDVALIVSSLIDGIVKSQLMVIHFHDIIGGQVGCGLFNTDRQRYAERMGGFSRDGF